MNYIQYMNAIRSNRMRKMAAESDLPDAPPAEKPTDTSFGTAFTPGWTNTATGLLGALIGGYVGNRYAGTPGLIAGGLGGGALGYTGGSLATNVVERIRANNAENRTAAQEDSAEQIYNILTGGKRLDQLNQEINNTLAGGSSYVQDTMSLNAERDLDALNRWKAGQMTGEEFEAITGIPRASVLNIGYDRAAAMMEEVARNRIDMAAEGQSRVEAGKRTLNQLKERMYYTTLPLVDKVRPFVRQFQR